MPVRFSTWARWAAASVRSGASGRRRSCSNHAIAVVETLEQRLLMSATAVEHDDHVGCDHEADLFGNLYHSLSQPDASLSADTTGNFDGTGNLLPLSQTFFLHSNPGASHAIYLDFDGHVTSGTTWNYAFTGGAAISTPAFDFEGGVSVFSNNELARIQYIWQRVTEDFLPFDVDVTTQDPGSAALSKSGGGDAAWGIRVAIGGNSSDWFGAGAGGVAYIGSFNWNSDAPVFVFTDNLGDNEKYTAEAISHEVGHALGLYHDGNSSTDYYQGSGSGATGWAPIMGVGYYRELTFWSRGDYSDANNTEDDLAIITSANGFGYRADDYGNTAATAGSLIVSGTSAAGSGIMESGADRDVFAFATSAGSVSFSISPSGRGANLDLLAELYNSSGTLIASANPSTLLSASLTASVSAGTYYLHVSGVGKGSPTSGGYSDYASLGAYRISGTVVETQYPDLAGDYLFNGAAARITQNGGSLTFINERGNSSAGYFLNSSQVVASGWGNLVGNISGESILWANGATWTRGSLPSIAGDYLFNGGGARVLQSGSSLTFINEHGNSVAGRFLDATHVQAVGWGNLVGTISGDTIVWANGTTWTRTPDISGNYTFNSIAARVEQSGSGLTFVNERGNSSAGRFLDATHVQATGWGNLVGTLNGNRIEWANGTTWVRAATAAVPVTGRSIDFDPPAENRAAGQPLSDGPVQFTPRDFRFDSLRNERFSVAANAAALRADSRFVESAPIDVDEVFAAFDALQSSMYERESDVNVPLTDRDGLSFDGHVELHAGDLLELVLELDALSNRAVRQPSSVPHSLR